MDPVNPRLKIVDGELIQTAPRVLTKVEQARLRFGRKFVHEPGSTWKPNETPVLTRWMQTRGKSQ